MADSVLIIGGEPDLREKLSSYLTEAGYEVTSASDYAAAKRAIQNFVPDIIIIGEVYENGMDCFVVCKRLHDDYSIPVIVVGKVPNGEMWKHTVDAGGDCYIRELISRRVLDARLRAILRRYKGRTLMETV